ncbi:MAG: glycosyltransferase family 2 protein [Sphingomonadales bacterium]
MIPEKTLELSVVIVNYNVSNFLEQCLNSVFAASQRLQIEVFVVDNNSVDGSVEIIRKKFPAVKLIANAENVGFSKANNQAILQSKGRYLLLLNPDTVVEQDTFDKCIAYMDSHPQTGGLGVRMLDGKGRFLPESKRGLPTPAVSFYKIFGFSKLFPKSKKFGKYHLGFLDEHQIHEVDVLSGAFMFMRAETLSKIGLLDEAFFMYGEDIDLSYRIQQGGYTNVYFPETKIIHYKGESTKKGSLNYVFVFYNAMVIFAKKHFSARHAHIFSMAIHTAIYLRATASIAKRLFLRLFWPSIDAIISFVFLHFLGKQWEAKQIQFPDWAYNWLIPSYILTWLFCAWLFGLYDKGTRSAQIWKSTFFGTVSILVAYALFPKEWQFSRLFILLGAAGFLVAFYLTRSLYELLTKGRLNLGKLPKKRFGIIANSIEFKRISELLSATYPEIDLLLPIDAEKAAQNNQIDEIIRVHQLNELIFSAQDIGASNIIQMMADTSNQDLEYKIAQPNTSYLIGSSSIDQAGAYYNLHFDALQLPANKRLKRIFDFLTAFLLLLFSPLMLWIYKHKNRYLSNLLNILIGRYSFVGVGSAQHPDKKGKAFLLRPRFNNDQAFDIQAFIYTKSYSLLFDFKSVWKQVNDLDNQAH